MRLALLGATALLVGCLQEDFPGRCDERDCTDGTVADDTAAETSESVDTSVSADGAMDAALDAPAGCHGIHGPAMVEIDTASGRFCIDTTEVTIAQFIEYLSLAPIPLMPDSIRAWCPGDGGDLPTIHDAGVENRPVTNVTWCHAAAYCAWAHKRLCGAIGKDNKPGDGTDNFLALDNEWGYACKGGTSKKYPYGVTFDPTACVTKEGSYTSPQNVASDAKCHGAAGTPFAAIFDMTGNAAEWENFVGMSPIGARYRGGGYSDPGGDESNPFGSGCERKEDLGLTTSDDRIGFRCCADPL